MSRVGRSPIQVPSGVEVTLHDGTVAVSGPQGKLQRDLPGPITVRQSDAQLLVERPDDERANRALHGLTRSLIQNMVTGVTAGFTKELEIVGVGYRATLKSPKQLELALGFSHPVFIDAPEGVTFEVPTPLRVIVRASTKRRSARSPPTSAGYASPSPTRARA